jgi:hypothetical protein
MIEEIHGGVPLRSGTFAIKLVLCIVLCRPYGGLVFLYLLGHVEVEQVCS